MTYITIYLLIGVFCTIRGFLGNTDECMRIITSSETPVLVCILAFGGFTLAWPIFILLLLIRGCE